MTPQEQQLIDGLVDRIRNTPATDKDADADRYLHQNLDTAPDALYVLAQTVLVQQYGLENAQKQLQEAQAQITGLQEQLAQGNAQPKKPGSFLSHLLGTDEPQQQAQQQGPPYQPVNTGYSVAPPSSSYGVPVYGQPVAYGQPMGYGSGFGGGGGFLRGAIQTAAGVAAGEMVFRGMEDLFSGFGGHDHLGGQPSEVINNNYYGDDAGHEHHAEDSSNDSSFYNPSDDASRQGLSPDIEDRRGFADTNDGGADSSDDDSNAFAASDDDGYDGGDGGDGSDNSGGDDGGGYDDGGGSDDSGF